MNRNQKLSDQRELCAELFVHLRQLWNHEHHHHKRHNDHGKDNDNWVNQGAFDFARKLALFSIVSAKRAKTVSNIPAVSPARTN